MSEVKSQINHTDLQDLLMKVGLQEMVQYVDSLLLSLENSGASAREAVTAFVKQAASLKDEQRAMRRMKAAQFPVPATLEDFDFSLIKPKTTESRIRELANCQWIERAENLLLRGESGLGKTHLSIALGRIAVARGFGALFMPAGKLFDQLEAALGKGGAYERRMKRLMQFQLLILDDFGFSVNAKNNYAPIFYELVDRWMGRGSLLITTNRTVKAWGDFMGGDTTCVKAGLDRFLGCCHVCVISGNSFRMRQCDKLNGKSAGHSGTSSTAASLEKGEL